MDVSLREINKTNVVDVCLLKVTEDQRAFVADNAFSLAQAMFEPEAWYRAIHANDELVGFVMLFDETLADQPPEQPAIELWRFMIDQRYQGRGIGREVLQQVIAMIRKRGVFKSIELSFQPDNTDAEALYRSVGFKATGAMEGDEIVMSLVL